MEVIEDVKYGQPLNDRQYKIQKFRIEKYERFLDMDFEEYLQQPQTFDVSLFKRTNISTETPMRTQQEGESYITAQEFSQLDFSKLKQVLL